MRRGHPPADEPDAVAAAQLRHDDPAGQRLSTILVADRAIVLRDGRVVESGLPQDLIRLGGAFTALFGDEALAA